jgi:hypothetical protein
MYSRRIFDILKTTLLFLKQIELGSVHLMFILLEVIQAKYY